MDACAPMVLLRASTDVPVVRSSKVLVFTAEADATVRTAPNVASVTISVVMRVRIALAMGAYSRVLLNVVGGIAIPGRNARACEIIVCQKIRSIAESTTASKAISAGEVIGPAFLWMRLTVAR